MHFRLIILVVVCALLNIGHARAAGSDLDSRKLGIDDIPECGVCKILNLFVPTDNSTAHLHDIDNLYEPLYPWRHQLHLWR